MRHHIAADMDVEVSSLETEAAEWVARVATDPSPQNIAAAREWCGRSGVHGAAFEQARWLWTAADHLQPVAPAARVSRPRRRLALAAAASLVAAIGLGAWMQALQGDYRNGSGGPQSVALEDGSILTLDAQSAVNLRFTPQRRDIDLLKGAALFDVAHDPGRPFVVHGLGVTAMAVGTVYTVGRDDDNLWVMVKHGVVRVDTPGLGSAEVRAGQRVGYEGELHAVEDVDVDARLAWQRDRLIFNLTPLEDVVAALNRYRPGYIVITDSSLARLPVSGVFRIERADDVLAMLEQAFPIKVHRLTNYLVLLN